MKKKRKKTFKSSFIEWSLSLGLAIVIALFIRGNVFAVSQVKEHSMENTFFEGQRVIELKINPFRLNPKRGDVIILHKKKEKDDIFTNTIIEAEEIINNFFLKKIEKNHLIKRVIGVPGDVIDIKNGYLYLNGVKKKEMYIKGKTYENDSFIDFPVKVPKNSYFVMGDNREVSLDSRQLGFILNKQIEGKVIYRIWPINKLKPF
ncbi:MAG: signal peptidase I [Firmicutes bacterium]|nr:signal peptidase I [Bacillota bacterium]